jgi:hypothetical protein
VWFGLGARPQGLSVLIDRQIEGRPVRLLYPMCNKATRSPPLMASVSSRVT